MYKLKNFFLILRFPESRRIYLNKYNEQAVIEKIREFCDANNLLLIVKAREKFSILGDLHNKADLIILEGWCVGSKPIEVKYLKKNVNNLEKVTNILFSNKRKMINKSIKKILSQNKINQINDLDKIRKKIIKDIFWKMVGLEGLEPPTTPL